MDINVKFLDLPYRIHEFVVHNNDLSYTIVLNSRLSHEMNMKSYYHAMEHIKHDDFCCNDSVDMIEIERHDYKKRPH